MSVYAQTETIGRHSDGKEEGWWSRKKGRTERREERHPEQGI